MSSIYSKKTENPFEVAGKKMTLNKYKEKNQISKNENLQNKR